MTFVAVCKAVMNCLILIALLFIGKALWQIHSDLLNVIDWERQISYRIGDLRT